MEDNLRLCNQAVMIGEKIRATPIPPVYSAHAARLLIFAPGFARRSSQFRGDVCHYNDGYVYILRRHLWRLALYIVSHLFFLCFVTCLV